MEQRKPFKIEEQAGREHAAGPFSCEFSRSAEAERRRHSGTVAVPFFCSVRIEGFCSTDHGCGQRSSGLLPKEAEGCKAPGKRESEAEPTEAGGRKRLRDKSAV